MQKMGIWRDYLVKKLADRERAMGYLQAILDDYYIYGGAAVVKDALDTIVEAQGGVSKVAKQVDMDPQLLSKVLSNEDAPLIDTLGIVLKALGYQLSIKPIKCDNFNLETDADELGGETARVAEGPISLQ